MPIYEYQCEQTNNIFEVNQSINAQPLTTCQLQGCECQGKGKAHRIISKNVGVIFKGTGFYETDYVKKQAPEKVAEPPQAPACKGCANNDSCPSANAE